MAGKHIMFFASQRAYSIRVFSQAESEVISPNQRVCETSKLEDLIGKKNQLPLPIADFWPRTKSRRRARKQDSPEWTSWIGGKFGEQQLKRRAQIPQCGRNVAAQALAAERVSEGIVTVKPAWQLLLRRVPGFLQSGWFQGSQAARRFTIKH